MECDRVMATMILCYEIAKSRIPIESGEGTFEVMGAKIKALSNKNNFLPTVQPTKFAVLAHGGE